MSTAPCPHCGFDAPSDAKVCPQCERGMSGAALMDKSPATKTCPNCGKTVKFKSDVCKFCHGDLSPGAVAALGRPHPETKLCPFCAEEIKWAANVCKHCGRELAGGPTVRAAVTPTAQQAAKPKTSVATLGCATIIGIIFLGWCASLFNSTPTPNTTTSRSSSSPSNAAPASATPQLALLSSRGYESDGGGYHIVEGEVENLSGASLRSVAAQATWYDKDGGFVTSDDSLIEFNPILPGQKSPFKVMSRTNPAMSKYTVSFKHLFGGAIVTDDRRKK